MGRHKSGKCAPSDNDINSRAALSCLYAGIGQAHLDGMLSTMNIPTMSRACFKTQEEKLVPM